MSRSTNWCGTLFLPDEPTGNEDRQAFKDVWTSLATVDRFKFGAGQLERCPTTGKLHIQFYVITTSKLVFSTVSRCFAPHHPHLEIRKGSHIEALAYVAKEDTRVEGLPSFGVPPVGAGFRSDLQGVAESIANGELTRANIRDEVPATFCRNRNGILDLLSHSAKRRTRGFRRLTVEIYYGKAGTGKTRKAHEENEDAYTLETSACGNNIWFDGYDGESTVIVDDFYGWIRWNFLLKFLDGYQLRLPVKGGHTWAEYTKVIFTSNAHPSTWYSFGEKISWEAFRRRVDRIVLFQTGIEMEVELKEDHSEHTEDLYF